MIAIAPVPVRLEPRWRWPRAAYVHVPFCAHKCGYCDFASLAGVDHLADRYLAALEREIEMSLGEPQEVDTIFVGGGTPTRLDAGQLSRLTSDHQAVADPGAGRRVDRRGQPRDARRREGRRPGRSGRRSDQSRVHSRFSRTAPRPGA